MGKGGRASRRPAWCRWKGVLLVGSFLLFFTGGTEPAAAGQDPPARPAGEPTQARETARIAALLDAVEHSGARFVRNGMEYSGVEGRRHLEGKLRHAGERSQTAEEFIEGVATRSSLSGRPYLVRTPEGEEVESGVWLRRKLAELEGQP